jgi:hypothetical protein
VAQPVRGAWMLPSKRPGPAGRTADPGLSGCETRDRARRFTAVLLAEVQMLQDLEAVGNKQREEISGRAHWFDSSSRLGMSASRRTGTERPEARWPWTAEPGRPVFDTSGQELVGEVSGLLDVPTLLTGARRWVSPSLRS